MTKNPRVMWLQLRISGTEIPVYCTRLDHHGLFDEVKWRILIDVRQAATPAVITLLHEWHHARQFMNDHLDYTGEAHELACDEFSRNVLEVLGGPPPHWTHLWDVARELWKSQKTA